MASQETLSELIKELDELRNQYDALQRSLLLSPLYDSDNEAIRGLQSGDVFSNGNTGFVLCCSALVMLMSLPGISLFYSGAVKVQNVMVTFIQTMTISAVVSILWMACGYSLAFSPADSSTDHVSVYGDYGRMWLIGMDMDSVHQMAPTIPETAFCMFQLSKAILACTLLMGGFACRTKFLSVLVFISFWLVLVLCPLSHMHGHPAGWMFKMDVLDFAGGNVVHISSGITAYLASYFIGPRSDTKEQARFESRNILLCVWGACFMFIGWFGFNMGSAYCTSYSSSRSMLITVLGASSAAIAWISIEWFLTGTPSILGMLCGSVAGLVSMSAGAGYIDHTGAVVTGAVSGVTCYLVVAKKVMAVDDPLNTFSLNFFGGVVGSLCVGLFSKQHDHSQEFHDNEYAMGAFFGNPKQLYIQLMSIAVTVLWSALASGLILLLVDKTMGLRVPESHEEVGLDIAQLHESIINTPSKKLRALIARTKQADWGGSEDDLDARNRGDRSGSIDEGDDSYTDTGSVDDRTAQPEYTQKSILSGND